MPKYSVRIITTYPTVATNPEDALTTLPYAVKFLPGWNNMVARAEVLDEKGKVVTTAQLVVPMDELSIKRKLEEVYQVARRLYAEQPETMLAEVANQFGGTVIKPKWAVVPLDLQHCIEVVRGARPYIALYQAKSPHDKLTELFQQSTIVMDTMKDL